MAILIGVAPNSGLIPPNCEEENKYLTD